MKEYDAEPKDKNLSLFEFDQWHKAMPAGPEEYLKCTVHQEQDPNNKNIGKCSTLDSCYDFDAMKYSNDKCINPRESCGGLSVQKYGEDKQLLYNKVDGFCQNPKTLNKYEADGEGMSLHE